jgi:molecular chaperone GrpE
VQADFENARKRAVKEQEDFREYAAFETIKSLLPVLDSFERALKESSSEHTDSRRGMELIYKQLMDSLFKIGVRPIDATGARFDPGIHQALGTIYSTLVQDQCVIEQLQRGYRFKDRLLRPAMVMVARRPTAG